MDIEANPELQEQALHAYQIMRSWQWVHYDPDGLPSASTMALSKAVHRLAFDGHQNPKSALLNLFQLGKIQAICSYNWRKYINFDIFNLEGDNSPISMNRWRELGERNRYVNDYISKNYRTVEKINLKQIGLTDCEICEWVPEENRMSYSSISMDRDIFDDDYYEEFYAVWNIAIMPMAMPGLDGYLVGDTEQVEEQDGNCESNRLEFPKPNLSEADLQRWWQSKVKVRDDLTKDELLALVRAKFPDHHTSRDRIRDLAGPRKTGPKSD